MKITDRIYNYLSARRQKDVLNFNIGGFYGQIACSKYPFARLVFSNICQLLIDLGNDVTFQRIGNTDIMRYAAFKSFYNAWFKVIWMRLYEVGYIVIGFKDNHFYILQNSDYTNISEVDMTRIKPNDPTIEIYVIKSDIYSIYQMSHKQLCQPALQMLDSTLNASCTIAEHLGAVVIGTPSTPTGAPTLTNFSKEQKEKLEKDISEQYGALARQRQIMILPNDMKFQTINLAGLDVKTAEKTKTAVLMICDCIGVPANQVALVDANSNKTLANGSELREGDFNKYQSFERLLNETFIALAENFNIHVDYTIYNKPQRQIV